MEKSLIPLSFVAEYAYCPRSAYWLLTDAPQVRDENEFIQDGRAAHRHVDRGYAVSRDVKRSESSVSVVSDRLGISGKVDVVEFWKDGEIIPVEFKRGTGRDNPMHVMQLALAALCLRERFPQAVISRGAIFFVGSRRRREVVLDEETLNKAENLALEVGKKVSKGLFPRDFPALKDDRCEGCCFRPLCFL